MKVPFSVRVLLFRDILLLFFISHHCPLLFFRFVNCFDQLAQGQKRVPPHGSRRPAALPEFALVRLTPKVSVSRDAYTQDWKGYRGVTGR